jgi:hypothetical protein
LILSICLFGIPSDLFPRPFPQQNSVCISCLLLRRIFRPKKDEVTGGWRKFRNEELHKFYFSPNIIRMMKDEMGRNM